MKVWKTFQEFLSLVRFSHTLFALPFAVTAAVWAAHGWVGSVKALFILGAMVTCRNTAMAFNRLVDANIDAKNPRTAKRHIPSGRLSKNAVVIFLIGNATLFIALTAAINSLAFYLSLPTLAAVCGYSLTKRVTAMSHFFLGFAIAISPVGAWIAVTGTFAWPPFALATVLGLWIAGFDMIYATQDEDFDRKAKLHSMVVTFGRRGAIRLSAVLHFFMWVALSLTGYYANFGREFWVANSLVAIALVYVHGFRRTASLDRLNQDFFLANVGISLIVMVGITWSVIG